MKPGMLHHIELYVSDLEETIDFWGWFLTELGYDSFQEWDGGKSWKLNGTYIVFVQVADKFKDNSYHRSNVGLNHLAFVAQSKNHVDEITEKLKSKGIKILYEHLHPFAGGEASYAVFFEDPDRIKIELVAP